MGTAKMHVYESRRSPTSVIGMVAQGDGGATVVVVGTGHGGPERSCGRQGGAAQCRVDWSDELKPPSTGVRGYVRSLLTDESFDVEGYDFIFLALVPTYPRNPRRPVS